ATQIGGTMSSLKFSYWSSPQTRTKSGLKSSRILRIARKSLPNRSPQRLAAESPSSLPSSASNSFGQLRGSLNLGSTLGASSTRLNTPVRVSLCPHRVGQWVQPRPSISAILPLPMRVLVGSCRPLREARHVAVDFDPRKGIVAEDLPRRGDEARVVERAGAEDREARARPRLLEQRRAAFAAERPADRLAAAAGAGMGLRWAA